MTADAIAVTLVGHGFDLTVDPALRAAQRAYLRGFVPHTGFTPCCGQRTVIDVAFAPDRGRYCVTDEPWQRVVPFRGEPYLRTRTSGGTWWRPEPDAARQADHRITASAVDLEPRMLHHDLQPGHLVATSGGQRLLLDWELAAFGDPLSDFARLAVRLGLGGPDAILSSIGLRHRHASRRFDLYWRIHRLADAAFATQPTIPGPPPRRQ